MKKFLMSVLMLTVAWASQAQAKYDAVPGEYLVKVKKEVAARSLSDLSNMLGVEVVNKVSEEGRLYLVKADEAKLNNFSRHSDIEYVEPNYILRLVGNRETNDPEFKKLWGLKNTGQYIEKSGLGVAGIDIAAEEAWKVTTGSRDVVVAVIDTGVDFRIDDLKEQAWVNEAELNGKKGVDDDGNGYIDDINGYNFVSNKGDQRDDHGHGSHVAGTIGASANNGKQVAGVAWNVRIMGIKFLSKSGSGTLENAIKAIDYATKMGAHISNNSWGGGPFMQSMKEAIERANNAGSLFVAAAGNESNNNDIRATYPAGYEVENVISVAAIDNKGSKASFSNYGKKTVHLAAPGVQILSTTPSGLQSWSGTSMATPHVTGVAALVKSLNMGFTPSQLKSRLLETAQPVFGLSKYTTTGGMVNAYNAVTGTVPPPDMTDPKNWPQQPYSLSTPHPYGNNLNEKYVISAPGAKAISVYFSKFETERFANTDYLIFSDKNGKELGRWSGKNDDSFSPVAEGDEIVLTFITDKNVTYYGFDIEAVAVKP